MSSVAYTLICEFVPFPLIMKSRSLLLLAFLLFLGLLAIVLIRRSISSMSESPSEPHQTEEIVAAAEL